VGLFFFLFRCCCGAESNRRHLNRSPFMLPAVTMVSGQTMRRMLSIRQRSNHWSPPKINLASAAPGESCPSAHVAQPTDFQVAK